jgi:predicted kinase
MLPPLPSPSEGGRLVLPARGLVLLVGVSGSGKSTFAAHHFAPTQILSSDAMRAMVADDPNDQAATDAAFELLHTALSLRLARGRLTVVDATNVERWARGRLIAVARRHARASCAIVLAPPLEVCLARNLVRGDRRLPPAAIRRQQAWLQESLPTLPDEGLAPVWVLSTVEAIDASEVVAA